MIAGDGFICGKCVEEIDPPSYFAGECTFCDEDEKDEWVPQVNEKFLSKAQLLELRQIKKLKKLQH